MELALIRTYYPAGTNGSIMHSDMLICSCIELPWRENRHGVSCVPEGSYVLVKRYSPHFQWHFELKDVPLREDILIHPANDAELELKGCIAPVTELVGEGKGLQSRLAFEKLKSLLFPVMEQGETIIIQIKIKKMNIIKRAASPTPGFFKRLRNIGLAIAAIGAAIATAPVSLPTIVVSIGGYFAVAGTVIGAVSQITTFREN